MPRLSVPPSTSRWGIISLSLKVGMEQLTRKAGRNKDTGESAKATDEGCTRDTPVLKTNEVVIAIGANVDKNAEQDKDYDGGNFE
jgi:hypothetical protein